MEQLKTAILRKINRTMESPKDFEYLSEQQQQILLDSLQTDKRNLEIKNRADSLKIDSLSSRIATLLYNYFL